MPQLPPRSSVPRRWTSTGCATLLAVLVACFPGGGCGGKSDKKNSAVGYKDSCVVTNGSYSIQLPAGSHPGKFDRAAYASSERDGYTLLIMFEDDDDTETTGVHISVGAVPGSPGPAKDYPLEAWTAPPSEQYHTVRELPSSGQIKFYLAMRRPAGTPADPDGIPPCYVPAPGQQVEVDVAAWPTEGQPGAPHFSFTNVRLVPDTGTPRPGLPAEITFSAPDLTVADSTIETCSTTPIAAVGAACVSFHACADTAACGCPTLACQGGQCCSFDFVSCSDDAECCSGSCTDGACGEEALGSDSSCKTDDGGGDNPEPCVYSAQTGVCWCPIHRAVRDADHPVAEEMLVAQCPSDTSSCYIDRNEQCPSTAIDDEACTCYREAPGAGTCAVNEQVVGGCPQ